MDGNYLQSVIQQMQYYKLLGEKTFVQLTDEQLFWQYNEQSNSIATIVRHMSGNMLSRWTDFLISDGEKEWRNRDAEFANDIKSREYMLDLWDQGWRVFLDALQSLQTVDLSRTIYIRNQGHTITEAINRQLAHYSYHVGQIVYLGKMCAKNWQSLSIPPGASSTYNTEKFSEPKHHEHYTSEFLKPNSQAKK